MFTKYKGCITLILIMLVVILLIGVSKLLHPELIRIDPTDLTIPPAQIDSPLKIALLLGSMYVGIPLLLFILALLCLRAIIRFLFS